jgi:hypothetical protein
MVVIHKLKVIFVHIPKCAGTSMEQFLKDNDLNVLEFLGTYKNRSLHHLTSYELLMILRKRIFSKYYRFSIVRNPYERLLSEYYWTPIYGIGYKSGGCKKIFLDYVSKVVKNKDFFSNIYHDHFMPQYNYLFYKDKLLINNIFKYESLEYAIPYLKNKFNIKREFPILNKRAEHIVKEDWTIEEKEIIYKLYEKDFILFNYEK